MSKNRLIIIAIAILIIIFSIPKPQTNNNKLKIACTSVICLLPYVAQEQGYFAEEGLEIEVIETIAGKLNMDAIIAKDADLGFLVESNIAFIGFQKNHDIRVIASLLKRSGDSILARQDKNISKPADLKGKKIGYFPATTSHMFLARFLDKHNISWDEIEPVMLPAPSLQAGIIAGGIDAISIWNPWNYNSKTTINKQGVKTLNFNNTGFYPSQVILGTSQTVIDNKSHQLHKFMRAIKKAEIYCDNNFEKAQKLLSDKSGIELNILKLMWDIEYKPNISIDDDLLEILIWEGKHIKQRNNNYKNEPLPDFEKLINKDFVGALNG